MSNAANQKPGFHAADDDMATQPDILAAQAAIDRKNAKSAEEAADTAPDAPLLAAPVANDAYENSLKTIAAFYDRTSLLHADALSALTILVATDKGIHLQGTENTFLIGKSFIQADTVEISPRDALEMAALAVNNQTMQAGGISLSGGSKERYLLTLAARKFDLDITNAFEESDIPEAEKAEFAALKAEWLATIAAPVEAPVAPLPAPVAMDLDTRVEPILGLDTIDDQTPQETAKVQQGQDRLKDILSQAATAEPAEQPVAADMQEGPATMPVIRAYRP